MVSLWPKLSICQTLFCQLLLIHQTLTPPNIPGVQYSIREGWVKLAGGSLIYQEYPINFVVPTCISNNDHDDRF